LGTGGGIVDANDTLGAARLNQKTWFVGTGSQINTLAATYSGQLAYCTVTGSGFTLDRLYERNNANTLWVEIKDFIAASLTESAEQELLSNGYVTDDSDLTMSTTVRYYGFVTLPTTEKFYTITAIQWRNGGTVAGSISNAVELVNADPPSIAGVVTVAAGARITQSGINADQKNSRVTSAAIRGGAVLGVWVQSNNATSTLKQDTGLTSQNQTKTLTGQTYIERANVTAWTAQTFRTRLTVFFRGYS